LYVIMWTVLMPLPLCRAPPTACTWAKHTCPAPASGWLQTVIPHPQKQNSSQQAALRLQLTNSTLTSSQVTATPSTFFRSHPSTPSASPTASTAASAAAASASAFCRAPDPRRVDGALASAIASSPPPPAPVTAGTPPPPPPLARAFTGSPFGASGVTPRASMDAADDTLAAMSAGEDAARDQGR